MNRVVACAVAIITTGLALTAPIRVAAQDSNYWSQPYGPRSMLLSGAVIGSVTDMSAVFYNPGALGYIKEPELLLSANAYEFESLRVENGGGEGIDLTSSQFNLLPNMLAGAFRKSWLGNNKIAYSFLTRHRFDAELRGASTGRFDVLPDPGEENFAGGINAEISAKEFWAGVTWAHAATGRIGFGVTTFFSVRSEEGRDEVFAQALTDSSDISLVYDVDNFSSNVYSLLWKAGLGVDLSPLSVGLTVTTPNLQIFGSGESTYNSTTVRVDRDDSGTPENAFETDLQTEVSANYKSPLSIGFGAGYFFERTQLHFSAEWFAAVDGYDVMELDPFTSQTTGEVLQRSIRQKRDEVFNVAAGIQQKFGENHAGFLGFRTDNSAFNPESDISVTGIDVVHLTGGGAVNVGRTNWMIGLGYAWGSETATQIIDFNPDDGEAVVEPEDRVDLKYSRWTFMIGFRVGL